jgi:hypothetical protein
VKYPAEKKITALAIVSEKNGPTETTSSKTRPTIICGLQIRCRGSTQKYQYPVIDTFDDQNKNSMDVTEAPTTSTSTSCLYLVVYDFMYSKEKEDVTNENKTPEVTTAPEPSPAKNETTQDENQKNSSYHVMHPDVFVEHLSSIYKTLIPGESDEVFLPPPMLVNKPQHSGPRVLPIDMQITETDSSQTEPFIINQDYSFMNGQLSSLLSETFEKSISDHITEMKNSKTAKKLNYSRAVQCVSIPGQYKNRQDLDISDIIATQDGRHVLVVLKSASDGKSVLLLYSLDFSQKMVKVVEEPVLVRELNNNEKPVEVNMLPLIDKLGDFSEHGKTGVVGNIVMVCVDGAVRIVELSAMRTICMAQLESEKFVSAAYCNSKLPWDLVGTRWTQESCFRFGAAVRLDGEGFSAFLRPQRHRQRIVGRPRRRRSVRDGHGRHHVQPRADRRLAGRERDDAVLPRPSRDHLSVRFETLARLVPVRTAESGVLCRSSSLLERNPAGAKTKEVSSESENRL